MTWLRDVRWGPFLTGTAALVPMHHIEGLDRDQAQLLPARVARPTPISARAGTGLSRAINPSTAGTAWFTTATARHAVPAHSSRAAPPVVIGGFPGGLKRPCLTGWKLG